MASRGGAGTWPGCWGKWLLNVRVLCKTGICKLGGACIVFICSIM